MFKFLSLECTHCESEMNLVVFKTDHFGVCVGAMCPVCDTIVPVDCIFRGNDFRIVEKVDDLPF